MQRILSSVDVYQCVIIDQVTEKKIGTYSLAQPSTSTYVKILARRAALHLCTSVCLSYHKGPFAIAMANQRKKVRKVGQQKPKQKATLRLKATPSMMLH